MRRMRNIEFFVLMLLALPCVIHAVYVDYHSALADSNGLLREGYSMDGLHPNDKGYAIIAPLVQAAIEKIQK